MAGETLPSAVVAGAKVKGTVTVGITDLGAAFAGRATVSLYASTTPTLAGATAIAVPQTRRLQLRPAQMKAFTFRIDQVPPALAAGTYYLVPEVTSSAGTRVPAASQSTAPTAPPSAVTLTVSPPFVALSGAIRPAADSARPGGSSAAVLTLTNGGNVAAAGPLEVELSARPAGTAGDADVALGTVTVRVHIKPGGSVRERPRFRVPGTLPAGRYALVAALDPGHVFGGGTPLGSLVGATTFAVA